MLAQACEVTQYCSCSTQLKLTMACFQWREGREVLEWGDMRFWKWEVSEQDSTDFILSLDGVFELMDIESMVGKVAEENERARRSEFDVEEKGRVI